MGTNIPTPRLGEAYDIRLAVIVGTALLWLTPRFDTTGWLTSMVLLPIAIIMTLIATLASIYNLIKLPRHIMAIMHHRAVHIYGWVVWGVSLSFVCLVVYFAYLVVSGQGESFLQLIFSAPQ